LAAPGEVIHPDYTVLLRDAIATEHQPVFESHETESLKADLNEYENLRSGFVSHAHQFTNYLRNTHPRMLEEVQGAKSKQSELATIPDVHVPLIQRNNRRYRKYAWRRTLSVFPDRAAIGRWSRLIMWYAIMHAAGRTKRFDNNFDDAHYGFLASYAGHLVTHDDLLAETVSVLFPKTRIHSSLGDVA
jgi:hypothetical protein